MILWLTNSLGKQQKIYESWKIKYTLCHEMHNFITKHKMDLGNKQYTLDFNLQSFLLYHCEEIRK